MQKNKVLLVDDVQLFLEQEKTFFERDEFDLLVARSGVEALRMIMSEKPELVFMDLYMPEMDGDRCCTIVKNDEQLRAIPVIMVTQGVDENDFQRCWKAGCNDIISKPINRNYFMAITRKYLPVTERKSPRYTARLRVQYGLDSQTLLADYSVNLSTGGLFIETVSPLPVGTPLVIEFILPANGAVIECQGKVAWVNHPEMLKNPSFPSGMGLQFLAMPMDDMNSIREFIKNGALLPYW